MKNKIIASWAGQFKASPRKHMLGVAIVGVSATLLVGWLELARGWKELQARTDEVHKFEQKLVQDMKDVNCFPTYGSDGGKGI